MTQSNVFEEVFLSTHLGEDPGREPWAWGETTPEALLRGYTPGEISPPGPPRRICLAFI